MFTPYNHCADANACSAEGEIAGKAYNFGRVRLEIPNYRADFNRKNRDDKRQSDYGVSDYGARIIFYHMKENIILSYSRRLSHPYLEKKFL